MEATEKQSAEFFAAMDRLRRAWHGVTPCRELSKSQFGTLFAIFHYTVKEEETRSAVSLTELAGIMNQSVPALSQRVRSLEELGYVERVADEKDRRISGVRLTEKGRTVLLKARERVNKIMSRAMDELGQESSRQLLSLLGRLTDSLQSAAAEQREEKE